MEQHPWSIEQRRPQQCSVDAIWTSNFARNLVAASNASVSSTPANRDAELSISMQMPCNPKMMRTQPSEKSKLWILV
jgi:hypothetical protein